MLKMFRDLVDRGQVDKSPIRAIRVKTHSGCNWSCRFCHMEGNALSTPISCNKEFERALVRFRDEFGFTEVHLTGGEPTIHPEIIQMVEMATRHDFLVKLTTNGQRKISQYQQLVDAGVSEFNFSLHTLDGKALASLMLPQKPEEWGKRQIDRQLDNIQLLRGLAKRKINTVIVDDETQALAIAEIAQREAVSWRPMNELQSGVASYNAIKRLCDSLGAVPQRAQIIDGSSSCSVSMKADGFEFKVKLIRPFCLPSLCESCPVYAAGKCTEFAYGPRLEADQEELKVRMCIHRNDAPRVQALDSFFTSQVAEELRRSLS